MDAKDEPSVRDQHEDCADGGQTNAYRAPFNEECDFAPDQCLAGGVAARNSEAVASRKFGDVWVDDRIAIRSSLDIQI